jgi:hypothetical protein
MLSTKKSAQTLVFIAFFPFITIPTAKSGLNKNSASLIPAPIYLILIERENP